MKLSQDLFITVKDLLPSFSFHRVLPMSYGEIRLICIYKGFCPIMVISNMKETCIPRIKLYENKLPKFVNSICHTYIEMKASHQGKANRKTVQSC